MNYSRGECLTRPYGLRRNSMWKRIFYNQRVSLYKKKQMATVPNFRGFTLITRSKARILSHILRILSHTPISRVWWLRTRWGLHRSWRQGRTPIWLIPSAQYGQKTQTLSSPPSLSSLSSPQSYHCSSALGENQNRSNTVAEQWGKICSDANWKQKENSAHRSRRIVHNSPPRHASRSMYKYFRSLKVR